VRQAIKVRDGKTLKAIAPMALVEDHAGGVYATYTYSGSMMFRVVEVRCSLSFMLTSAMVASGTSEDRAYCNWFATHILTMNSLQQQQHSLLFGMNAAMVPANTMQVPSAKALLQSNKPYPARPSVSAVFFD
jgi:hypothetical protein